jgi:hypothetical protein
MSKLKPIGSEKLQGVDKIKRMIEISKYKEVLPNSINENDKVDYTTKLVDGNVYQIVKEKQGYIIKKGINESVDYLEPMKNRQYFSSYAEALKKLNLVAQELNRLHNINEGISLFTEDKKYFLKNPNPAPEATSEEAPMDEVPPMDEPMNEPMPESDPMPPADDMPMDSMPDEPTGLDAEDMEGPETPDEDVSFKVIQKLTGKLAQKIRDFQEKDEEITSKDAKYVVNSILSALADNLEDDDKEDIISKLEGEEDADYGMEPSGMEDEMPADDMGMEDEMPADEEMPSDDMGMEDETKAEVGEAELMQGLVSKIFSESKVDKILSKYFVVTESEKKFNEAKENNKKVILEKKKKMDKKKIGQLSESAKQASIAENIVENFPEISFVGKTNKGNLVFEHNNKQLKVSPKGELL